MRVANVKVNLTSGRFFAFFVLFLRVVWQVLTVPRSVYFVKFPGEMNNQ